MNALFVGVKFVLFASQQSFVRQLVTPVTANLRFLEKQPPELLSEDELIAVMDKNGIGTDATMAEHIKKIQDRNYALKVLLGQSWNRDDKSRG